MICSSWCLGLLCIVFAFLWNLKSDYWSLRASLCIHLQVQIHKFVTNTKVVALMAEWLRRWTRNPMGSARAGSNPAQCEYQSFFFFPSSQLSTFFPCTYITINKLFSEIILTYLKIPFFCNLLGPLIRTVQHIAVYRMILCSRNTTTQDINNTCRHGHVRGIQLPADSPNATFFLLISFLDQLRVFIGV